MTKCSTVLKRFKNNHTELPRAYGTVPDIEHPSGKLKSPPRTQTAALSLHGGEHMVYLWAKLG